MSKSLFECIEKSKYKLIIYVAKDCIPCLRLLRFLTSIGISFDIKRIDENKGYLEELEYWTAGKSTVPVVVNLVNGRLIIGCPVLFEEFISQLSYLLDCD